MSEVDTGGTSSVPPAAALRNEEAPPVPEPSAGGTYTRDPVTHELVRKHAESGPATGVLASPPAQE